MASTSVASAAREPGIVQGVLLVAVGLLSPMAIVLLAPAVPQMLRAYAADPHAEQLVMFALTCPALCVALLTPFVGYVVDRFGRRNLLIASLVVYPVFGAAPLYLKSLEEIVASRLCVGVAESILLATSMTMLGDFFEGTRRERFLALNTATASIAASVFFAVGGVLADWNWRLPYAVYLIAVPFLLAVIFLTWEPRRVSVSVPASGEQPDRSHLPLAALLLACLVTIAGGVIFMVPQIEIGMICAAQGYASPAASGLIAALGSAAMPIGAYVYSRLRRAEVSIPRLVVYAFLLTGAGLLTMAVMSGLAALIVGMVVHQFGCGFMLTGLMAWVLGSLDYEHRGKGTGAYFAAFFIAQPISGFLFQIVRQVSKDSVLTATAAFGLTAIILGGVLIILRSPSSTARQRQAARP